MSTPPTTPTPPAHASMADVSIVTKTALLLGVLLFLCLSGLGTLVFLAERHTIGEIREKNRADVLESSIALREEQLAGMRRNIEAISGLIAQVAGQFVYDLNQEGLFGVFASFMNNRDLVAITVSESSGTPFAAIWREAAGAPQTATALPSTLTLSGTKQTALDIRYRDELIGRATIHYSERRLLATVEKAAAQRLQTLETSEAFLTSRLYRSALFLGVLFAATLTALLVIVVAILNRRLRRPLEEIVANLGEMADGEGDLTHTLFVGSRDEMGRLAENFNRFTARLRDMTRRTHAVSGDLLAATDQIRRSSRAVNDGAVQQSVALEESFRAIQGIESAVSGIAESTDTLVDAVDESSSATMELGATIEEIAAQMEKLFATVDEVSSSINQMSVSSQEITENVETLSSSTEVTASSVTEMDASIKEIEENAEKTSRLSEEAALDAQQGKEAVDETIQGIGAIRESVDHASLAIQELGNQSQAIGKILTVIDEVADQTSLLALNAAIIAAQAGEHGRGFAVVADEIRELAERTAVSTREIAAIIGNLQNGTRDAVKAMEAGSVRVHQEVERSKRAGVALEKIRNSTLKAREQVAGIVRATQEQSRGSRQITNSINQVAAMLDQIASAIKQQSDGTRQLARAAEAMKEIASHGKLSTGEQAKGSRQINQSMERIRAMIERIDAATHEQSQRTRQVVETVSQVRQIAEATTSRTAEMDQVVEVLSRQTAVLENEVGSFKTE